MKKEKRGLLWFALCCFLYLPSAQANFWDDIVDSVEEITEATEAVIEEIIPGEESTEENAEPPGKHNADVDLVRATQKELKRIGYEVSVDGAYGPGTRKAIMKFESDNGLNVIGNVSPQLLSKLKGAKSEVSIVKNTPEAAKKTDASVETAVSGNGATSEAQAATGILPGYIHFVYIPNDLLQLKLRPDAFDVEAFHEVTKGLVKSDIFSLEKIKTLTEKEAETRANAEKALQNHSKTQLIKYADDLGGEIAKTREWLYFREDQVAGRNPDFAYRTLAGEVRERMLKASQVVPTKFYVTYKVGMDKLTYDFDRQAVHSAHWGDDLLFTRHDINATERLDQGQILYSPPGAGGRNPLYTDEAFLRVEKDLPHPVNYSRPYTPRFVTKNTQMFALREMLVVPALDVPMAEAEQLMKKFQTSEINEMANVRRSYIGALHLRIYGEVVGFYDDEQMQVPTPVGRLDVVYLLDQRGDVILELKSNDFASANDLLKANDAAEMAAEEQRQKLEAEKAALAAEEARKKEEAENLARLEKESKRAAAEKALQDCASESGELAMAACRESVICKGFDQGVFNRNDCMLAQNDLNMAKIAANLEAQQRDQQAVIFGHELTRFSTKHCMNTHKDLMKAPLYNRTPEFVKAQEDCMARQQELVQQCQKDHPFEESGADRPLGNQAHYDAVLVCLHDSA